MRKNKVNPFFDHPFILTSKIGKLFNNNAKKTMNEKYYDTGK